MVITENITLFVYFFSFLLFQTSIFEALAPSFQIAFSLMSHSLGGTGEAIYHLPRVN